MNKLAYICAPFSGDIEQNKKNAIKYAKYAYDQGFIPITPHLLFPFLDDNNPKIREWSLDACIDILMKCSKVLVFCYIENFDIVANKPKKFKECEIKGITEGMWREIKVAKRDMIETTYVHKEGF